MGRGKRSRKQRDWREYLNWGPFQWEALGLLLIALGAVSGFALVSITHGAWSDGWAGALRQAFGLGAFPVVVGIVTMGVLFMRRHSPRNWNVRWERVIGLEVFCLAALGLLHLAVPGDDPLTLAKSGGGGGYVGWAISNSLAQAFGYEICAVSLILLGGWGLITASPLTLRQLIVEARRALTSGSVEVRRRLPRREVAKQKAGKPALSGAKVETKRPVARTACKEEPRINVGTKEPKPAQEPRTHSRRESSLPSLDILDKSIVKAFEESEVRRKARTIEETLGGFGLPAKVVEINRGPAVTQYGVEPGLIERRARDGETQYTRVRVAKITSLVNDLALALAASPIRIEAPVPGRSMVGIEVPNEEIAMVSLRGVMESEPFRKMKSSLKIALGKDVSGQPIVADLAKMPHLLIAGATGSGKSVCINAIVSSLLFNNAPDELRLLLVDPKMVELTAYNGIPHLLSPVVTQVEEVVGALTWVTKQMEERYRTFSAHRCRNIEDYNGRVARKSEGRPLPYMVVIIDELADLMMSSPVEVEWAICRIAQMARATGIHLVIATQRPSVDVITGLIKANFPARISFAVTSQVDSRVMLDTAGAETLLGRGDMLFMTPDASRLVRIQGCFVSDREINDLVSFWRGASGQDALPLSVSFPWSGLVMRAERDELLDEAIELVRKNGRASASFLQRRLRIGYPRAARLVDQLEEEGVIGPPEDGSRFRQVSDVDAERWDAELDRELDADFSEQAAQKEKGTDRGVS